MATAGGLLMAFGVGAAQYAHTAALVFSGAMLLLLATLEKGPEKKPLRVRLLVLFFLLLFANLRLPPLDFLEAAVIPLTAAMYGRKSDKPLVLALLGFELGLALLRTLAVTGYLGAHALKVVGSVLAATAILRFAALLRLNRRAAREPGKTDDEIHSLR